VKGKEKPELQELTQVSDDGEKAESKESKMLIYWEGTVPMEGGLRTRWTNLFSCYFRSEREDKQWRKKLAF